MIPVGILGQNKITLVSLTISPSGNLFPYVGQTVQLTVTAHWSDSTTSNVTNIVPYHSTNTVVATISSAGLVTTLSKGSTTIIIDYLGATAHSVITVQSGIVNIGLAPSPANIPEGFGVQLVTTAYYYDGSFQNITSAATYNITSGTKFTLTGSYVLSNNTGLGTGTVRVVYEGFEATTTINVTAAIIYNIITTPSTFTLAAGATQQLTTTAYFSNSTTQNVTNLATHSSNNTSRATVNSTGLVTAQNQAGAVTITSSYDNKSSISSGTITAAVLTSISISPTSFTLQAGTTRQMAVTAHFSNGSTQNVTSSASYSSNNNSRGTVNSNGLVTAGSTAGAFNITATYLGQTAISAGTTTVVVVNSISVNPTSFSLAQGQTRQLVVTAHFSDSTTQVVTGAASYSSNQTGRMTVNSTGLVTAGNTNGAATITITYEGKSTTSAGTTTAAIVTGITASPSTISLPQGRAQVITVTATLSNGSTQNVSSSASYSSNQPSRMTVSSSGVATAGNTNGASTITITYSGFSTTVSGTTTAAVVDSISVTPQTFSLSLNQTRQLAVTATMSNSTSQNVTSSATYTRTNTNITVSSGGLVTAVAAGSSNVNISYGGASTATTGITITSVTLETMTIEYSPIWMAGGGEGNQNFSVRGTYSDSSSALLSTDVITAFMDFNDSTVTNIAIEPSGPTTFRVYQEGPPYVWSGVSYWDLYYFGSEGSPFPVRLEINIL